MKQRLLFSVAILLFSINANGFIRSQKHALVEGPYAFSPLGKYDNGYPEEKYQAVLDTLERVYGPVIDDRGGSLKVLRDWNDGAVNMWAERWGNEYILEIPGGMSRYHLITEEGFLISICHEIGHLLGGQPARGQISYEGQSDFYAGQSCTRLLKKIDPYKKLKFEDEVILACEDEPQNSQCLRILQGAKSLTSYFAELAAVPFPSLQAPSQKVVLKTIKDHPEPQCRLDTIHNGYFQKPRPTCWYKKESEQ